MKEENKIITSLTHFFKPKNIEERRIQFEKERNRRALERKEKFGVEISALYTSTKELCLGIDHLVSIQPLSEPESSYIALHCAISEELKENFGIDKMFLNYETMND